MLSFTRVGRRCAFPQFMQATIRYASTKSNKAVKLAKKVIAKAEAASARPTRPVNAYIGYMKDVYPDVKASMPAKTRATDIGKRIAAQWSGLSAVEKEPYVKAAADRSAAYKIAADAFAAEHPAKAKSTRPLGAFFVYSKSRRSALKAANPGLPGAALAKAAAAEWALMTDQEKLKFASNKPSAASSSSSTITPPKPSTGPGAGAAAGAAPTNAGRTTDTPTGKPTVKQTQRMNV